MVLILSQTRTIRLALGFPHSSFRPVRLDRCSLLVPTLVDFLDGRFQPPLQEVKHRRRLRGSVLDRRDSQRRLLAVRLGYPYPPDRTGAVGKGGNGFDL
jgi:hypothetical protein